VAWQLLACLCIEDTMFYWSHRLLHSPLFYAAVHKVHHEYSDSIGLTSEHAHPLEFLLGNQLPVIVGPLLLRCHLSTLLLFLLVRLAVSIDEHSGLCVPWSPVRCLPWGASAEGHAFHHANTVGIYASQWGWWDALCGTDAAFLAWAEAEEAKGLAKEAQRGPLAAQQAQKKQR
jgi:sterol desaturase/sphingolipid hydroxylase (fatty acid hydroxylase superfamily)